MKIVQQDFALNQPGSVKIFVEEQDDLWLAYNIIAKGDTSSPIPPGKLVLITSIERNLHLGLKSDSKSKSPTLITRKTRRYCASVGGL